MIRRILLGVIVTIVMLVQVGFVSAKEADLKSINEVARSTEEYAIQKGIEIDFIIYSQEKLRIIW